MNDVQRAVYKLVRHRHKGNAISRDELVKHVSLLCDWSEDMEPKDKDRLIRNAIRDLRKADVRACLIVASSSWAGYWMAGSREEIEASFKEEMGRALTIYREAKDVRARRYKWLNIPEPEGQMVLFDVAMG